MTTTPKLGLFLPQGSDLADVQLSLSDQLQKIDNELPVAFCTKSTFPASPWDGKLAFTEDTQELWFYNAASASWKYILSRKNAWGRMAYTFSDAVGASVGQNQEKGPYITCTFNQIKGRIYRVGYAVNTDSGNTTDFGNNQIRLRYQYGAGSDVGDTLLYFMWADMRKNNGTSSVSHSSSFTYTADQDGQITIGMYLWRGSGNQSIFFAGLTHNCLFVEDMGWQ